MPYLEHTDCKLYYRIDDHTDAWARPESVLFVHGFTETTEAWRAWVPHFSRRYRVIRIDQRGFGKSGPIAKNFTLTRPPAFDFVGGKSAAYESAKHRKDMTVHPSTELRTNGNVSMPFMLSPEPVLGGGRREAEQHNCYPHAIREDFDV